MKLVREILDLLTARQRSKLYLLIVLSIITGLLQTLGVASIMPFISVVSNPQIALENRWLSQAYNMLGFQSTDGFLIFLGVAVFAMLAISNAAAAATTWFSVRFSWMLGHDLSQRLLHDYLYRPYSFFLNRNSSELGMKILTEIWEVVQRILLPGIKIISNSITSLFILLLLLIVDPLLAVAAIVVLGGLYSVVYFAVRNRLSALGRQRVEANQGRFQAAGEAFGGIKDVKVLGKERAYLERFRAPSRRYAATKTATEIISVLPKYGLELIAFGGIILIVIYLLAAGGNIAGVLPVIGLYAFASYRLKPALQSIFSGMTAIRNGVASLDAVYDDLQRQTSIQVPERAGVEPLVLRDRIEFRNLSFTYEGAREPVFRNLDLEIEARTSVAFVGATGSGKTTLVDILMGLLRPQEGELRADGELLEGDRLMAWQNAIGYVPQHIYLGDISVAWNIAFGELKEDIDMAAVERAAKLANIHDFIVGELPEGYDTIVGEDGVRLSGGQRQRIGIARALYHDPDVLILDEATSALDGVTEKSVFSAVDNVRSAKTVVMIAHRLTTVRDCDVVYLLEHGEIVASGTYDELLDTSTKFRNMAMGTADEVPSDETPLQVRA